MGIWSLVADHSKKIKPWKKDEHNVNLVRNKDSEHVNVRLNSAKDKDKKERQVEHEFRGTSTFVDAFNFHLLNQNC